MLDESISIWRHQITFENYKKLLVEQIFPQNKYSIPPEIQSQFELILSTLDSDPTTINDKITDLSQIINQYGHGIHPYITSKDISNIISLLDFSDLQETLIPILWSCSILSSDIVGYLFEADSFIPKIMDIFFSDINLETKLIIIKIFISCSSHYKQLTSILIKADFFNKLLPFCEESKEFITITSILLYYSQVSDDFIDSAFPILQFVASNSEDPDSISRILYIFSNSIEKNDTKGLISQFIISDYIEKIEYFLINEKFIILIDAIITLLNTIITKGDIEIIKFFFSRGINKLVLDWLFKVNDINSDVNENNKLSILVLDFLSNLLENINSDEDLLSSFVDMLLQRNFIEFCKVSSFILYERITFLILDTIVNFLPGTQTKKLFSEDYLEILIQLFEITEYHNRENICFKLRCILLFYQDDKDFCKMINSMWLQNDCCVGFCSDLIEATFFNPD